MLKSVQLYNTMKEINLVFMLFCIIKLTIIFLDFLLKTFYKYLYVHGYKSYFITTISSTIKVWLQSREIFLTERLCTLFVSLFRTSIL